MGVILRLCVGKRWLSEKFSGLLKIQFVGFRVNGILRGLLSELWAGGDLSFYWVDVTMTGLLWVGIRVGYELKLSARNGWLLG